MPEPQVNPLPASLLDAFALAAGELGMFSAARLFCEQMFAEGGAALVGHLRELIGPVYPVLDVVAARVQGGAPLPSPDPRPLLEELRGIGRVVTVGTEAWIIDALVERLPATVALGVVLDETLPASPARIAANLEGRATLVALDEVVRWSGARTALLTAVYGSDGYSATVCTAWLRLMGPDTRTCFGALVGWNLLGPAMEAYPRWLQHTLVETFTVLVDDPGGAPIRAAAAEPR